MQGGMVEPCITTLKELNLFLKSTHKEDKKKFLTVWGSEKFSFRKSLKKDSIGRQELAI